MTMSCPFFPMCWSPDAICSDHPMEFLKDSESHCIWLAYGTSQGLLSESHLSWWSWWAFQGIVNLSLPVPSKKSFRHPWVLQISLDRCCLLYKRLITFALDKMLMFLGNLHALPSLQLNVENNDLVIYYELTMLVISRCLSRGWKSTPTCQPNRPGGETGWLTYSQLYASEYSLNGSNWPYSLASNSPEELVLSMLIRD